jgi:Beta/Gamma crystallin/Glycine zipper 2TM domain
MNRHQKHLPIVSVLLASFVAMSASATVIFYENENFGGRTFTTERGVTNFQLNGFNDRASSVVVMVDRVEICEDADYQGQCTILRPGRYESLSSMGMNNRISSVRIVNRNSRYEDDRYAPQPVPVYDNRRRGNEKLYDANITSTRAVLGATGPSEQRCWVEREQVNTSRGDANIGGAILGSILGGVLGHQVGGGRGKDIATAAGAVAGGAVGANVTPYQGKQKPSIGMSPITSEMLSIVYKWSPLLDALSVLTRMVNRVIKR